MITVVLADDDANARHAYARALTAASDIELGAAVPTAGLPQALRAAPPDLVLLDVCPEDTPAVAAALDPLSPRPPVGVVSEHADEEYVAFALEAGARGYLLKQPDGGDVVPVARLLADGWTMLSAPAQEPLVAHYLAHRARRTSSSAVSRLTGRETDVLTLLAHGLTNQAIAHRLHIGHGTVKDHIAAILGKLDATGRVQAALLAERAGLLTPAPTSRTRPDIRHPPQAGGAQSR